ncbi:Apolipophorins [Harpegnathos saltator]|uniref:Apolipophorins n=1 Tax=Harpegnathos saltator TaxID=610380 RepID=E2C0B0_HARSA|nr:Apolipophorins [Harpegnathos saltator]
MYISYIRLQYFFTLLVPLEQKFKYQEDVNYVYTYSVDVSTNLGYQPLSLNSQSNSSLHIDATLSVQFTSPCEGNLRILNASISHDRSTYSAEFPDRAGSEFKASLERYVLRFSFDDGVIHELCPDRREPVWALNLKRGVLSMLQNSMKRFDVDHKLEETDVYGICDTKYHLYEALRTSLIVKKSKNLADCQFGPRYFSIVQSNPYRSPRRQQGQNGLLKSHSECDITIDHNVYAKVVCEETRQMQPLSNGQQAGARTDARMTLKLVQETTDMSSFHEFDEYENNRDEDDKDDDNLIRYIPHIKRTTLLYDHTKTLKTMHGELRTSRDLLKIMCRLGTNAAELQQRFSETFTNFVHSARSLNYPSLSQLFMRANSICRGGKNHILAALPYLNSNAAVNVMRDLIMKKYVNQATIDDWIITFALLPQPDHDTIKALSQLLDFQHQIPHVQFILSYSTIIHTYCRNNNLDCIELEEVNAFLSHLEKKISQGCTPHLHSPLETKETLEALKAIGNMGLETKSLRQELKKCIDDTGGFLPMEVRVAAVDAHRRLPSCEETRDEFFLDYYRNITLDTEIRIASYLQVMRCPDYNVIKTIKHALKMEEVNQVGTFVWSHLSNIYSSSSPTKIEIQSLLTDRDFSNKFNNDVRKFSRNYDDSFFSEEYNIGANYQTNLIFSSKSYVPRSLMFNVTADVFGQSVNLFEVTARMEGFEFYAENLFGPNGIYSNEKIHGHIRDFLRHFRSAPESENYWNGVKRLPNVIDNNFAHPKVSFGYKIFGNELKFTILDGDEQVRTALAQFNPWQKIREFLAMREILYERTTMFLDSSYVVPMGSGMPIRLDIAGSAACNLKVSKTMREGKEFELTGNIASSLSVDTVGTMTVDAFYKSAGLRLRTNLYSSGSVQIHLNLNGTRLVRVSLGLPSRKIELLSLLSDVALIKGNGAEVQEKPLGVLVAGQNPKKSRYSAAILKSIISNTTCSWTALDRLIGLKMCTDYQVSNVTKEPNAPYFILNGLTLFKVSLNKADPTAKNYVFEYSWNQTQEHSTLKLMFNTPGSQVDRELSAIVTFDMINNNVTVLVHSAGNSLIAKGTYKNSENETFLDVGFDINGTKHLDASLGYTRTKLNSGYAYDPRVYLTINSERVAAISGSVKDLQKNNASQIEVNLSFQTKRVWSNLSGYILTRNISVTWDLKLEYQLQRMPKREYLIVQGALFNRSSKTLTHKAAEMTINATAYPQLNTMINASYQQALGHLELQAEVNLKPNPKNDQDKLKAKFIVSYLKMYFQDEGTKMNAMIAVTKPTKNLDIKVGINHYSLGAESKTTLLIGYAPAKEINLLVHVIMPRGILFSIEGHTNLTIPNYSSMLLNVRINERFRHEYELDFSGTWFSGHNFTARGAYSDRSIAAMMNHHLKMILKSPSFANLILVNCYLYQDHSDLKISLYAEQPDFDKYAFMLNHTVLSATNLMSYVEARYRGNVYSVMTNVDTTREIRLELHLDKWRDVHVTLTGINEENRQEFAAEMKWDANRDPALKVATMLQLTRIYLMDNTSPGIRRSAIVMLTYPGRLVTGSGNLMMRGPHNYLLDISLDWNPEDRIKALIGMGYDVQPEMTSMKLESQLLTPFEQWKKTALNVKYIQLPTKVLASSSIYWRDSQHVIADFHGSMSEHDDLKEWAANCGLTSTVHSFAWVTVNVTHKMLRSETADSHMLIKYNPDKTIDVRSIWHLDKQSDDVFNLTGNLHLYTPFANYHKGELKCQLRIMSSWTFFGAANLDLDKRKYTGCLQGDLMRWKESKVEFNVTTPLEKFAFVRGKFGLSESNRHIVAMIDSPNGPLGVEAVFQFSTSAYDFNVKFMLATPIDVLQKVLAVAKLNSREADFRVAYNNITAGFLGTWHYNNITDFDYRYVVLTPLEGLQECGVITKLIVMHTEPNNMLDVNTEFSLRLADIKLGVRAKGGPKPPPVKIPLKKGITIPTIHKPRSNESEEEEEEEEDDEDNFFWRGELEIWLAIIEDISGELDIDYEHNTYKILSTINLPLGKIVLDDNFLLEDVFHMKNDLHVDLSFSSIREITSLYTFLIDMENRIYLMEMNINVTKNNTRIETGFHGNYTFEVRDTDDADNTMMHFIKFNLKTPLHFAKDIRTNTIIETKGNRSQGTVAIRGEQLTIDLFGNVKRGEALLDIVISGAIDSPMIKIPKTTIVAKKNFAGDRKELKFNASMEEPVSKYTSFECAWQTNENVSRASAKLESWIKALRSLETDVLYSNAIRIDNTAKLNVHVKHLGEQEYQLNGNLNNGKIDAELHTPLSQEPHFQFHGDLIQINESLYIVKGELKNQLLAKSYDVSSVIVTQDDGPSSIDVTAEPKSANTDKITLKLQRKKYGLQLNMDGGSFNSTIDANIINSLNWDMRAQTDIRQPHRIDTYHLNTFMNVQVNGNTSLYVHAETPWDDCEVLTVKGNVMLTNTSGDVRLSHQLNDDQYHAAVQWTLIFMTDIFAKLTTRYEGAGSSRKDFSTHVFFKNPRSYRIIDMGFNLDIDRKAWEFETNATIGSRNQRNADAVFIIKLPPPYNDDHRFLFSYHKTDDMQDISYVIGYSTVRSKANYASDGSFRTLARDLNGHFRVTWGLLPSQSVNNLFNITFNKKEMNLKYSLYTPQFLQEETVVLLFNYDYTYNERNLINADLFYPPGRQIGAAKIAYESLINVNGTLNASIPGQPSYVGCNFVVFTTLKQNKRFIEFFWMNNTALLNSDYTYHSERLNSDLEGVLHIEVPLSARHIGHLTYGYKKRPQVTIGHSIFTYNDQEVLHAQYNSKSESRAGFEKDRIQVTVENIYKPIGFVYVNQYEYSGGNEGTNYPTIEFKQINIYRLDNNSAFNIAGESRVRTTHTGQNIHLKAMHLNRTIQFKTDYQVLPGEFDQYTWLSLAEDAWASYHVNIMNLTTEIMDNQFMILNISYPRHNFTLEGSYKITSDELNSEANLHWERDDEKSSKNIGAAFSWTNISATSMESQQRAVLSFRHPTFQKDVTMRSDLMKRDQRDLLNILFVADYSADPEKLLTLSALLRDESDEFNRKYLYRLNGKHVSTKMELDVEGFVHRHGFVLLETVNHARYKRGYMPGETGELIGRIDRNSREILFRRVNNEAVKYFSVGYYPSDSQYIINGSVIDTPKLNVTGAFFLDPSEKLTWLMVNYTPDAMESLRMYGSIPDARNAIFNIWRTYEDDLSISDISFYLKLNHSRLVTSTLRWRPELKSDIINATKTAFNEMFDDLNNDVDYWKQYIKSEVMSVITDVWDDAQQDISKFLDDWNDLKTLEKDFEDLRVYLNDSYNANDFYIKDIVDFGIYLIDELSLRSHIESLPNILNEIWEIMGESGEALRNSLIWLIENIKNAYNKVSEFIAAVLRGDSLSQVASIIEKLIEKYDMFIKDLHVSFIKYIENLWDNIASSLSQQWYRFLKLMEPLFIRFIHYLETAAWKASKEVLDFLYDRKKEIVTSPYFDRFTNFTQDIDKFYRDIKANDIVTNINKYSRVVIQFLKDRYFAYVPFGKELKDVNDDILLELKELQKLPSVKYALEKLDQVYSKVNYVYEYFEVRTKLENLLRLIHSKIVDISQSALQAENRYRQAKTMFIFDPNQGLMCLEQKLPMSWHAFNQTPEFHETPELRAIADIKTYFVTSNTTFWGLYYRYKPYSDLSNWLPPFKAQAMIIGSQHYVTFDGRYFDFVGSCTYLLARDFVSDTFAVLVKYNQGEEITHQIIVLIGNSAIELDLFNDTMKLISQEAGTTTNLQLPVELDHGRTYVYQEENIVTVEGKNNQFRLECNFKFNICTLELSGWYYGKTAGLLGTMSNEQYDDHLASNGLIVKDIDSFAHSWSIDGCTSDLTSRVSRNMHQDSVVFRFCEDLFVNKSSEFGICFDVINPNEYASMCLNSFTESEVCTVAMSYMQTCLFYNTYLRIPDRCTTCSMIDGSQVAEGRFKRLEGTSVPQSTDVVFIVEAKNCNHNIKLNSSMELLITQLNKELNDQGLTGNRWSLVVFGGDGVYDQPRSIVLDGQIFTKNVGRFVDYFNYVPIGGGSQDVFTAIGFASQLVFRAGVSKTFILLPCSHCESENQTLEYSVLHQVLLEHDITLHILMDGDFQFDKPKINKIFYGLDATKSYTKKDARVLTGDVDLRRQVKLSKDALGYCTPLSLETNGTIFSGDKLRYQPTSNKMFASVFAKRVALTATPNQCQYCECTADNNGVTQMECMPCIYPTPVHVNYVSETFDINETLSMIPPLDDADYGQIDIEDD